MQIAKLLRTYLHLDVVVDFWHLHIEMSVGLLLTQGTPIATARQYTSQMLRE